MRRDMWFLTSDKRGTPRNWSARILPPFIDDERRREIRLYICRFTGQIALQWRKRERVKQFQTVLVFARSKKEKTRKKKSERRILVKFIRKKTLEQLAAGIANKRKFFEENGLTYNTDEDGAEDFDSTPRSSDCDVSEVLSAPNYSGPPSADRLSSSSNDPVRRTMEIQTENTISKVIRWIE